MKAHLTLTAAWILALLAGCSTPSALVDYPRMQRIALAAISAKYPDMKLSELRLNYIQITMETTTGTMHTLGSDVSEVAVVYYLQPSATTTVKDYITPGKTETTIPAVVVRISNSGKVQSVDKGAEITWK